MAMGYSGLFKRRFAVMMPLSVFSSILVLYVFGLTGHMKLGVIVYIGAAGLVFLAGLTKCIIKRQMKDYVSDNFNFGFVFFIVALTLVFYMTDGRLLTRFDEFTHWGLTVKNYVIFDGFANVAGSTTHGAGYQPGMSLFVYLFTSLRDQVNECDMLKAMDVYVIAMLLPIFKRISWKRVVIGIFLIPVVLFAPWLFNPAIVPYNTLYIDAAMAVTFAYLLYHYYSSDQKKGTYYVMGMGSAVMVLIRPGSEAFALMILIMVAIDAFIINRTEFFKMCKGKGWLAPVFYVVMSVASWLSWRIFTSANHMMLVFDYVEPSRAEAEGNVISANFFKALSAVPENATIKVSYIVWAIIFAVMGVIVILLYRERTEKIRAGVYSILMIAGYFIYAAALLYMYIHLFTAYEGETLASFSRYMYTYVLGAVLFFLFMIIEGIFNRFGGFGNILVLVPVAIVLIFTPWKVVTGDMFNCREKIEESISRRSDYYRVSEITSKLDPEKDRVYFIAQNTNGAEYQVSYYLATPVSLSYDYEMGWSLGYPYSEKDVWTKEMTAKEWSDALIDGGYTYVYLYNVDKQFRSLYGELFEYDTAISDNTAFSVDVRGDMVVLKRAF